MTVLAGIADVYFDRNTGEVEIYPLNFPGRVYLEMKNDDFYGNAPTLVWAMRVMADAVAAKCGYEIWSQGDGKVAFVKAVRAYITGQFNRPDYGDRKIELNVKIPAKNHNAIMALLEASGLLA